MRNCDTCAKRISKGKCAVLTEMIGRNGDCWAWTDSSDWAVKVQKAYQDYAGLKSNAGRKTYNVDIGQVVELHKMGLTQHQIAERLGITRAAVLWRLGKAKREGYAC